MSEMTELEAFERFEQGMKKAEACARQLAEAQKSRVYNQVAFGLEKLRITGTGYFRGRQLARQEAERIVNQREAAHRGEVPNG